MYLNCYTEIMHEFRSYDLLDDSDTDWKDGLIVTNWYNQIEMDAKLLTFYRRYFHVYYINVNIPIQNKLS